MEVLLNTVWLIASIGAFTYWHPERKRASSGNRRNRNLFAVVALSCALLLLFPVISLTDDLHADQYPMEDSSRSTMKARNLMQGCLHASRSPFMAALTVAANTAAGLNLVAGLVVLLEIHPFDLTLSSSHQGRSPPLNK